MNQFVSYFQCEFPSGSFVGGEKTGWLNINCTTAFFPKMSALKQHLKSFHKFFNAVLIYPLTCSHCSFQQRVWIHLNTKTIVIIEFKLKKSSGCHFNIFFKFSPIIVDMLGGWYVWMLFEWLSSSRVEFLTLQIIPSISSPLRKVCVSTAETSHEKYDKLSRRNTNISG